MSARAHLEGGLIFTTRGVFVTFEGTEGSGKSVQSARLVQRLRDNGFIVTQTREPGGTDLGNRLRDVLLDPASNPVPWAEAMLMSAARAQVVATVIRPALDRGEIVVCDRFADSTLAYQGSGRGLPIDDLRKVVLVATGGLVPDVTLLLDLPAEAGLARKSAQEAGAWNRFEAEEGGFHVRVRKGFLALAAVEPHRWCVIDAALPLGQVEELVWRCVEPRLPGRRVP